MKKLLLTLSLLLILPVSVFAVQISVPSAPGVGYMLISSSTGAYTATTTTSQKFASSTLLADNNTFTGVDKFTNALSDFSGTWQTFSPSHFQVAGNYITGLTGDVTASGPGIVSATLASIITAGSCTNCNLTYDAKGRLTVAGNGSPSGSSFPFTPTLNFSQLANATGTQLWLQGSPVSLSASNTSEFDKIIASSSIGIGSIPVSPLEIDNTITPSTNPDDPTNYSIYLRNTDLANGHGSGIAFGNSNLTAVGAALYFLRQGSNSSGDLVFATKANGGSTAEKARLLSNGNLGIGTSSPYASLSVVGASGVVADHYNATSTTASSTFTGIDATQVCLKGTTTCLGSSSGNAITALTGDGTASGPGSVAFTLATVNSNIGTFNNITINGKGLATAGSNVSYLTSAITALGPIGQTQTGSTQTLATNTSATNGLTPNLVITASGNTQTFTSSLSGTLTPAGGGTGTTTPGIPGQNVIIDTNGNHSATSSIFIGANQNVGIGTTSLVALTSLLNINGALNVTGAGLTDGDIHVNAGNLASKFTLTSFAATANKFSIHDDINNRDPIAVSGALSNEIFAGGNGQVAINSSSPSAGLSVQSPFGPGTNNFFEPLFNTAANQSYPFLAINGNSINGSSTGYAMIVNNGTNQIGGALILKRTNTNGMGEVGLWNKQSTGSGAALTNSLLISDSGKVGIGSTTPFAKLSIASATGVDPLAVATSTTASTLVGGIDQDGHSYTAGPAPAISSCGTGSPSVVGDDQRGTITTGTAATACTATFSKAYAQTPTCTVTDNSLVGFADISSISTSAVTFGISSALTGGLLFYNCGYHHL